MACARCGCMVCQTEDFIALNKIWHKGCFCCYKCGRRLDKCTAKIFQGELFCKCCYCDILDNFDLVSCSNFKPCRVVSSPSCLCDKKLGCGENIQNFSLSFPINKKATCNKPTKSCSCLPDIKNNLFNINNNKNGTCVIIPIPREVANYYNRNTSKNCGATQVDFYNLNGIQNITTPKMKIRSLPQRTRPCKSPPRVSPCPPSDKCCCPKPHPDRCCCPKPSEKCKCCPQKCANCCPWRPPPNCRPKVLPDRCRCRRCCPPPPPRCCRDSNPCPPPDCQRGSGCAPPDKCGCRPGNGCPPADKCGCQPGNGCPPADKCGCRPGNGCAPPQRCVCQDGNPCPPERCCQGSVDKCCCPKCLPPTKCCCATCGGAAAKNNNCVCTAPAKRCLSPPRGQCCQPMCFQEENCQKCCRSVPPGPKYCACGNPNPCDCRMRRVREICTACCVRCGCKVYAAEKVVVSSGSFHTSCFSCYCCNKSLDVINVYEGCGEIYCKQCYNNFFGIQYYGRTCC